MDFLLNIPASVFIVLAALIAVLGSFAVQRFIAFRAACAAFRAAFSTDISKVANPALTPTIYVFLARKFPTHEAAVREFSIQLTGVRRSSLGKDWDAYGNSTNDIRQRYSDEAGHAEAERRRQLAVERLKKVVAHGGT